MTDQYGREIRYVRISVTDRCNLRCRYCMPREGVKQLAHGDILSYDEIIRLAGIFAGRGISRIKLTGGEPLSRRDLWKLVQGLKAVDGIQQVTLTTNGTLLAEQIDRLADAGLDAVNISLDTLDEAQYEAITRRAELPAALKGLQAAIACPQIRTKINCVPLAGENESQWVPLAAIARDHAVDVRFIEMMPIGLGREYAGRTQDDILKVLRERFGQETALTGEFGNGPGTYVGFAGFTGRIGFISAMTHKFCERCNRVRLTPEGYLKPCLQYAAGVDLRGAMRSGASDEELDQMIGKMIYEKPCSHHFENQEEPGAELRQMSRIGG
ncbi:MAG: GTP 3',8-cyclase MoaA [Eubacteriales bacterium]|nr:GTP 3',8-cyclase MoaA [Eubacteriales bacterium]